MAASVDEPHFLEPVHEVRREFADPEVEDILGPEGRVELEPGVLELDAHRRVGVLAECRLDQVGHVVAERARAEQVHFLRELEIVLDAVTLPSSFSVDVLT